MFDVPVCPQSDRVRCFISHRCAHSMLTDIHQKPPLEFRLILCQSFCHQLTQRRGSPAPPSRHRTRTFPHVDVMSILCDVTTERSAPPPTACQSAPSCQVALCSAPHDHRHHFQSEETDFSPRTCLLTQAKA